MDLRWFPVVLLAALTLAACARDPAGRSAARRPLPPQVLQYSPPATPARATTATVTGSVKVLKYPVEAPEPALVRADPVRIPVAQVESSHVAEALYTLGSGDRLRIIVFGQQNLSSIYTVDASGRIAMPLIGSVRARGRTPQQLAQSIAAALRRGYMRDPSVTAEIVTYRPFFILGEVTQPGAYPYVAHMTVETAVAIAGGYTPRGSTGKVKISRTVNGVTTRFKAPVTFKIRPGDTIRVKERWF